MQTWGKIPVSGAWPVPFGGHAPRSSFATLSATNVAFGTNSSNSSLYSIASTTSSGGINGYLVIGVLGANNFEFVRYSTGTGSTVNTDARLIRDVGPIQLWMSSYLAPIPTDSNIYYGFATAAARLGWATFNLWGSTALSTATVTSTGETTSTNSYSNNFAVEQGGVVIGIARGTIAAAPFTWTGLTEKFDTSVEAVNQWSGAAEITAASTPTVVGVTLSSTGGVYQALLATWDYY